MSMLRLVDDARTLFRAAVRSVQADRLFDRLDIQELTAVPLEYYRHVRTVGAGKAAMAMAGAAEWVLGDRLAGGHVVVPHGYTESLPESQRAPKKTTVVEAGHPVPVASSVDAARRALEVASSSGSSDLLLVLLSGGGSALWAAPAEGLTLGDLQTTSRALLLSGADIHQMNAVRKHLSRIKGGGLVQAAYPADVITLIISDVTGDVKAVIASGPTVPDPSTYADAVSVLQTYGVWDGVPAAVRRRLTGGVAGRYPETPAGGDACYQRSKSVLLGTNAAALQAVSVAARRLGYAAHIRSSDLSGEASEAGRTIAREAMSSSGRTCLVWGGETTVTVTGSGRGGRNQEVAAAAAIELDRCERQIVILSGGTDGIDGPTDVAGAWVTPQTVPRARRLGIDLAARLAANDTYEIFRVLGGHLKTGPTHTNVMDVTIALAAA